MKKDLLMQVLPSQLVVDQAGLGPATTRLWAEGSNQLSY